MLDINLKQLEAFVATAEYHSFTKAAETMYLTQSTVSSHISALERILDVRLIQRGARQRVALTAEGERVYREAKNILKQCRELQNMSGQRTETELLLGASSVPGQCLLPELMASFLSQHPEVRFSQLRGDSMLIHRYLEQGKVRIGFVGTVINRQSCNYLPIADDRLVVITPNQEEFRQLQSQNVSGRELLSRPMLLREETSGTRQAMEAYLANCGISRDSLHIVAQIDNPESIRSGVSRGLGISVISWLTVREDVEAGRLLAFDLDAGGIFRKIYMVWRKDTILTGMEHKFVRFVQNLQANSLL